MELLDDVRGVWIFLSVSARNRLELALFENLSFGRASIYLPVTSERNGVARRVVHENKARERSFLFRYDT